MSSMASSSSMATPTQNIFKSRLGRGMGSTPDSLSNHNTSQVQPMPGIHGVGIMGSGSQMRPGGIHQARPLQQSSSLRPPASSTSQPLSQSFQGHGLLRGTSVGYLPTLSSNSLGTPSTNQPWLTPASQGKSSVPAPSFRPQMSIQSTQQRSHIPQLNHPSLPASSPQQQISTSTISS